GLPSGWPTLKAQADQVLQGRPLDWLFISHPEIPHSGNVRNLLEAYPTAQVIGDVRDYHLYWPDIVDRIGMPGPGDVVDLGGGYRFEVLPAAMKDLPNTLWGYEHSRQVLFPVDGFMLTHHALSADAETAVHLPGECALTTAELPDVELDATAIVVTLA